MQVLLTNLYAWLLLWTLILLTSCGGNGGDDNKVTDETVAYYTVSGEVVGLSRGGLILQNNGKDDIAINADGSFRFDTSLADGSAYDVTIPTQSSDQVCSVSQHSGNLAGSNVDDVLVSCLPDMVTPNVSTDSLKKLHFTWDQVSADHYKLLKNPDGVSGYSQVGDDFTSTSIYEVISTHLMDWNNASYIVQACNIIGDCSDSAPISITPLMLDTIGYIKKPDIELFDEFGFSVALSGDGTTLAVGATGIDTVYLFTLSDENWILQDEITRPEDFFAAKMSLSNDGDTLAVSAMYNKYSNDNDTPSFGAVYIFSRSNNTWNQQAYVHTSNTEIDDHFGYDVSLSGDGDILAVTATGVAPMGVATSAGAVYIFSRKNETWEQEAYIQASNAGIHDKFGSSVQLSSDGKTLAVGAVREKNNVTDSGAVYVFVSENNSWTQQALIKAENEDRLDFFGCDVALSADGSTLAVGAYGEASIYRLINAGEANNSLHQAGAVYVFERNGNTWSQEAYIKASNADSGDVFGMFVALSADGNLLAASAKNEDSAATGINGDQADNSAFSSGAIYLFKREGTTWLRKSYVKAPNTGMPYVKYDYGDLGIVLETDQFGTAIALSADGTILAVGAHQEASSSHSFIQDNDSAPGAGAVYLY